MNKPDRKHNHAEAFCHMYYQSKDPNKQITVVIFNSRDGVTPFCFQSKEFGIELQHVNWLLDRYDPDYQPKPGDLIWRDATEEDKLSWFEGKKKMLRAIADPKKKPMADQVLQLYEDDPEAFFMTISEGTPVLQLVEKPL